MNFQMH